MTTPGMALRRARNALGLSEAKFGKLVGTSGQQIHRLEVGQRPISRKWAEQLAPHIGMSPEELMFPKENGKAPSPASTTIPAATTPDLTAAQVRAHAQASMMFLEENGDQEVAAVWLEALRTVVQAHGDAEELQNLDVLRQIVRDVLALVRAGLLPRNARD